MPWSGSAPNETYSRTNGTQTGTTTWADTKAASKGIIATEHDTHDQDLATALNLALKKDGGNKPTANINWGGFKITSLAAGSAAGDSVRYEQVVKNMKGSDVASADPLVLGSDGSIFDVTGTTGFSAISTKGVGTTVILQFDGILTITHHATDLVLPGGANITTAAGDQAIFYEYATGDWRCLAYTRAAGTAVVSPTLLDEDDFASDSATQAPTQQSAKAYVDAAVSAGTSPVSQNRRNISLLAFQLMSETAIASGEMADGYLWSFESDELTTSTNATYDASADEYQTGGAEALVSQGEGSTQTDYYTTRQSAAYDGNQDQATAAAATAGGGTTVARYGVDFGSSNEKKVTGLKTWGSNNGGYCNGNSITVDIVLKASNTDPTTNSWTGTTIGTIAQFTSGTAAAAKSTLGNANTTAYRYAWAELTFGSSTVATLAEVEFYATSGASDITLSDDAVTAGSSPDTARVYFLHEAVDSVTMGTDCIVKGKRNAGDSFTTSATPTEIADYGTYKMWEAVVDLSGATAGTAMQWEITTANSKEQNFKGVQLLWG